MASDAEHADCPLCTQPGGRLIYQDAWLRVVHAEEPGLEAFYRVIWQAHRPEWTDLTVSEQAVCMRAVSAVEQAMRAVIAPHKINLAALGNMVPHLHWHVVARYDWDAYFPAPVWAPPHTAIEALPQQRLQWLREQRAVLEAEMRQRLQAAASPAA